MFNDLEHPAITAVLRDGLPESVPPHCPICGAECDTIYYNEITGDIIACPECKGKKDAWECPDCFPNGMPA